MFFGFKQSFLCHVRKHMPCQKMISFTAVKKFENIHSMLWKLGKMYSEEWMHVVAITTWGLITDNNVIVWFISSLGTGAMSDLSLDLVSLDTKRLFVELMWSPLGIFLYPSSGPTTCNQARGVSQVNVDSTTFLPHKTVSSTLSFPHLYQHSFLRPSSWYWNKFWVPQGSTYKIKFKR